MSPDQDNENFNRTLRDAVDAVERADVPYLIMGGVGSATAGRPRTTRDIDLFVSPDAAGPALNALAVAGFKTEERDPRWLYKAWKYNVLVDVIFRSSGDVYLDDDMLAHGSIRQFGGCNAKMMAPEDLIVIKAITADEHVPHHWHDALSLLSGSDLDWDYLAQRARRHGLRRFLSLLLYAESKDIWVPPALICDLFQAVHPCHGDAP